MRSRVEFASGYVILESGRVVYFYGNEDEYPYIYNTNPHTYNGSNEYDLNEIEG
jgi:hypothetical protein